MTVESHVIRIAVILLDESNDTYYIEKDTGNISIAMIKDKGKNIPQEIQTNFGTFALPFWETFQNKYKKDKISILVCIAFSYSVQICIVNCTLTVR